MGCDKPVLQTLLSGFLDTPLLRTAAAGLRKVKIVDPHGAGQRRRSGRQAETVKDFADGFGWVNGRQDAPSTTAPIAPENVRGKYPSHQFKINPGKSLDCQKPFYCLLPGERN